jgi:DnaJ-class molecular chaperone
MSRRPNVHPELKGDRCTECNGSGTVIADFGFKVEVDCPDCNGTGLVNSPNACIECRGKGTGIVDFGGLKVETNCDHCNGSGLEPKTEIELGSTTLS